MLRVSLQLTRPVDKFVSVHIPCIYRVDAAYNKQVCVRGAQPHLVYRLTWRSEDTRAHIVAAVTFVARAMVTYSYTGCINVNL